MVATVITLLIYICVVACLIYLVIYVIRDVVGVPVPEKVIQILWVIFALIILLMLWQAFGGGIPAFRGTS